MLLIFHSKTDKMAKKYDMTKKYDRGEKINTHYALFFRGTNLDKRKYVVRSFYFDNLKSPLDKVCQNIDYLEGGDRYTFLRTDTYHYKRCTIALSSYNPQRDLGAKHIHCPFFRLRLISNEELSDVVETLLNHVPALKTFRRFWTHDDM